MIIILPAPRTSSYSDDFEKLLLDQVQGLITELGMAQIVRVSRFDERKRIVLASRSRHLAEVWQTLEDRRDGDQGRPPQSRPGS